MHVERRFERVALAAVAVAPDGAIDRTERSLVGTTVEHLASQQDHARARAEHGKSVGEQRRERLADLGGVEQLAHRGGFAARQDQRVERAELGGVSHFHRFDAQRVEHLTMLAKRPLQCQNANFHRPAGAATRANGASGRSSPRERTHASRVSRLAGSDRMMEVTNRVPRVWCRRCDCLRRASRRRGHATPWRRSRRR